MKKKTKNQIKNDDFNMARILYQRLGNDWYAFTEVDGDCFMTRVGAAVTESTRKNHDRTLAAEETQHTKKRRAA